MQLLVINDKEYLGIVNYELSKDQLWKEGSGRNPNDGNWYGSILGNYTNVNAEVYIRSKAELTALETDLLSGHIKIAFYDTRTDSVRTDYFYRANYQVNVKGFYEQGSQTFYDTVKLQFVMKAKE